MKRRIDSRVITAAIKEAKATGERIEVWDATTRGLCLRVEPSGMAAWVFRYRVMSRQRRQRLGDVGIGVGKAREAAAEIRRVVAKGEDPQAAKAAGRGGLLMVDAFEKLLAEPIDGGQPRRASTVEIYRSTWRIYIAPSLGRVRVDAVTLVDVERVRAAALRKIGSGRGNGGQAGVGVANRVRGVISALMEAAERWGHRPAGSNPCRGVKRMKVLPRKRYLRADERAALMTAIADAAGRGLETPGSVSPGCALALRLLVWTGARSMEIAGLRWGWVDLESRLLRIPAKANKTRKPKVIPLAPAAVELLRAAAVQAGDVSPDAPVCPASRDGGRTLPRATLASAWARVVKAAQLSDVRKHDLRHSFATDALNAGVPMAHVGAALGHESLRTTEIYAHTMQAPLMASVDRAGEAIAAAIEAGSAVARLPVAPKGKAPSKSKGTSKPATARGKRAK